LFSPIFWLAVGLSILEWVVVFKGWRVRPLTKPAPMLALIFWFTLETGWQGGSLWFGLALVFSLLGDILLLLPQHYFIFGLFSFLTAHIFYIIGFNLCLPVFNWIAVLMLVGVVLVGYLDFAPLVKNVGLGSRTRRMAFSLAIYGTMISVMLYSAVLNFLRPEWAFFPALLTGLGAVSFYLSDSILARQKFEKSTRFGRTLVMITYLTAQVFISVGAVLHFQ
jgi:uncharacterized membrane protein YhhN